MAMAWAWVSLNPCDRKAVLAERWTSPSDIRTKFCMSQLHVTAGEQPGDNNQYPQICMLCKFILKAIYVYEVHAGWQ
ncbi:hypothetical protein IVB34_15230 [Bradyrhizobium sp. 2]|uniref:hypothetical protein n=1 Tax=Bradyrhizobium sp. 2 TaxID=190045 RepID=UPI001FFA93A5|nr:hypothetical protein [Bradyrhizobium sp. 2]MCK1459698.1 hypothetical protein [Bradyrhizobium sp. 2]